MTPGPAMIRLFASTVDKFLSQVSYLPSYVYLRRRRSFPLRKLYACLEKFVCFLHYLIELTFLEPDVSFSFDSSSNTGFEFNSLRASLLTVLRFVYAIVRLSSGRPVGLRFRPQGLRFRPVGLRFRPVGLRFRPQGLRFRPQGLRFRPQGLRFRPQGLRFRPQGLRSSVFVLGSSFSTHPAVNETYPSICPAVFNAVKCNLTESTTKSVCFPLEVSGVDAYGIPRACGL